VGGGDGEDGRDAVNYINFKGSERHPIPLSRPFLHFSSFLSFPFLFTEGRPAGRVGGRGGGGREGVVLSVNCNLIIQRDRNGGLKCAHTRGVQVHREGDRQIEREREREREESRDARKDLSIGALRSALAGRAAGMT